MKWIESEYWFGDVWKYEKKDVLELEKWSLSDLHYAKRTIEKSIKAREKFLETDKETLFIKNGELVKHDAFGGDIKLKEIIDKKTEKKLYNDKVIGQIIASFKTLLYEKERLEIIKLTFIRKTFGKEYWALREEEQRITYTEIILKFAEENQFTKHKTITFNQLNNLKKHLQQKGFDVPDGTVKRILDRYDYSKPQKKLKNS